MAQTATAVATRAAESGKETAARKTGAVRIAIVGSGGMGHARASHLGQASGAQVVCVSSRNRITGPGLAQRCEANFSESWEEVMQRDDVDAVCVATHNHSHAAIAAAALANGKHVLVEYPLATTLDEADGLLDLAERQSLVLHVGHDQALTGWHLGIKRAAAELGQIRAVNGILATPMRGGGQSVWRNRDLSGPPFMVGIAYVYHLVDLFGPAEWVEGTSTYDGLDEAGYYRTNVSTLTAGFTRGGVAQLLYIRGFAVPRDEQEQAMMFSGGFLSFRGYVSGSRTNEGHLTRVTHSGAQPLAFPQVTLAQASQQTTNLFLARIRTGAGTGSDDASATYCAREAVAIAAAAEQAANENRRVAVARRR